MLCFPCVTHTPNHADSKLKKLFPKQFLLVVRELPYCVAGEEGYSVNTSMQGVACGAHRVVGDLPLPVILTAKLCILRSMGERGGLTPNTWAFY